MISAAITWLTASWRTVVLGTLAAAVMAAGAWIMDLRVQAAHGAAEAATARAVLAEGLRAEAEARAAANAAAALRLAERHQAELAAITDLARAQEARAATLSAELEMLRRDPTYDDPVAAVLDRAADLLRQRDALRASGPGGAGGAGEGAGGAAAVPAAAGGAGGPSQPGAGGQPLAGAGGGAR